MNDQGMPVFFNSDASIGRNLPEFRHVHPKIMLSLINLFGTRYLSSVDGYTVNANATRSVTGQTVAGSEPVYVVGSGFAALVTLSATWR